MLKKLLALFVVVGLVAALSGCPSTTTVKDTKPATTPKGTAP
jgi:hypothetical protein